MLFQNSLITRCIGIITLVFLLFLFQGCRKKQDKNRISKVAFSIPELYFNEAQKYARNGNFQKAEVYFLKSYQEEPNDSKSLLHLSYLYRITNKHRKGIAVLQRIINEFPNTKSAETAELEIRKILDSMKKQL